MGLSFINRYLFFFFFFSFSINAQEKKKIIFSALTGPFISNDGINVFVEGQITLNRNSFYIGPSFTQTNSSSVSDSYRGIKTGFKNQLTSQKDICSFIGIDYQYYSLSSVIKSAYNDSGHNLHNEINLFYSFDKKLFKNINLWFGSSIGFGFYFENYHFHKTTGDFGLSGYSRYLDLYIHYKFLSK